MSQLAQKYIYHSNIFKYQTICVEVILNVLSIANSQITKARDYNYYNHYYTSFFNSSIIIWLIQFIIIEIR